MRHIGVGLLAALGVLAGCAAQAQETIPLWPDGPPEANGLEGEEQRREAFVFNVSSPELTAHLPAPERATGAAVLICPGGGYGGLAMSYEGHDVAAWFNTIGVAGFVLKYRMPNGHCDIPLEDAQHALKTIRARAEEWGIDPERVGVLGFSAGGHLASTLATHYAKDLTAGKPGALAGNCRPDFAVLIYPVVTMQADFTHLGSRANLLGKEPAEELVARFSNELRVAPDAPPMFIVFAGDDPAVPVENGLQLYTALRAQKIPAVLHLFEEGGHGFGMGKGGHPTAAWPGLCEAWLRQRGVLQGK